MEDRGKTDIMGTSKIQALVINSSNFNRLNVERIKQTKKIPNNKEMRFIENNKILNKKKAIILAYSVKRIKE
jgi:ribosomal protein RSM22 (predicted rRNA methylase)